MNKSCVIVPRVRTKEGTFVDSNLFKDLLDYTNKNRKEATLLYQIIKSDNFKIKYPNIALDENNEPKLAKILGKVSIKNVLDDTIISNNLTKSIGGINERGERNLTPDTINNFQSLVQECIAFNNSSKYKDDYVALVKHDNGFIYITVEKKTPDNEKASKQLQSIYILNSKIRTILSNSGIAVTYLDTLQDELGANGIIDYENAKLTTKGLIELIKIANNSQGEFALPEEFAHFIIDVMKDNIFVKRLLTLCSQESVIKEVLGVDYESYRTKYSNDIDLIRECAGKLVYRNLLKEDKIVDKYPIIRRVIYSIKEFFKNLFNINDLKSALNEADKIAGLIANNSIQLESIQDIKLNELKQLNNLMQLNQVNSLLDKMYTKLYLTEKIFTNRLNTQISHTKGEEQKEAIRQKLAEFVASFQNLEKSISINLDSDDKKALYDSIQLFILDANDKVNQISKRLETYIKNNNLSNSEKAYFLSNCKDFINCYVECLEDTQQYVLSRDNELDFSEKDKELLSNTLKIFKQCESIIKAESYDIISTFLSKYIPENMTYTDKNGDIYKLTVSALKDILKTAEKDISFLDVWLQSAQYVDNPIIQLTDQAFKDMYNQKENRVYDIKKRLFALGKELKDAGINNTDFLYEKDNDGNLSMYYKSDRNWTKYLANKREFFSTGPSKQEAAQWFERNFDNVNNKPSQLYAVNLDEEFPEGSVQRRFYDTFMEIRQEMIDYLPDNCYNKYPTLAIQISKDLWDKIKTLPASQLYSTLIEESKKQLFTRSYDTQFGYLNLTGEESKSIPIFYVKRARDLNALTLSRDSISSLIAFSDMALNYYFMSGMQVYTKITEDLMKSYRYKTGKTSVNKTDITAQANNILKRYQSLVDTQMYGITSGTKTLWTNGKEEIKSGKAATLLNRYSSLTQLALNGMAGIASALDDIIQINGLVLSKKFFTAANLKDADGIYLSNLIHVLAESKSHIKSNKLSLFIEKFDLTEDYDSEVKDTNWNKSTLKKILSTNSLYVFMKMGPHWTNTRTALAQALNNKIKSKDSTKEASIWDILKVEYLDENDHSKGAKLVVNPDYEVNLNYWKGKFNGLNKHYFGAYSKKDINALQTTAVGSLVMLYRRFMIAKLNVRFGNKKYIPELDIETEGYYKAFGRFLKDFTTDSKGFGRNVFKYWNTMDASDKAYCKQAMHEITVFFVLFLLTSFLLKNTDWTDKKTIWYKRMLAYLSTRAKTDVGAFTPFGVFGEMFNIIKSPAAAVNTLENLADLTDLLNPFNYEVIGGKDAVLQSGTYEGHDKAFKALLTNIPMNRTVHKMFEPEESLKAFTNY